MIKRTKKGYISFRAIVTDADTDIEKSHITVKLDGREIPFTYSEETGSLKAVTRKRLSVVTYAFSVTVENGVDDAVTEVGQFRITRH